MKILIAYAYAGIGHKKAAEAIHRALERSGKVSVTTVDVLDWTNAIFRFLYPRIYLFLINRIPLLWGILYYFFDWPQVDKIFAPIRKLSHMLSARNFERFVLKEEPDAVVCTHFLPSDVVAGLKRKNFFRGRLITVITDFLPHSFWISRDSDYFVAALEMTRKDLLMRGIREEKIKVFGIPSDPLFSISKGREALLKKLGIDEGFFNLLIMGGGFGTGPIREIVYSVCGIGSGIEDSVQIIVICGKNKTLYNELQRKKLNLKIRLHVFGYVNNVDEFMEVSDCIITKSGGLTVSESLSKRLPAIIIQPIPGQEARNCNVLTGYGVAVRANAAAQAGDYVKDFISSPEKIIGMRARINLLSYPNAAEDIARFITQQKK